MVAKRENSQMNIVNGKQNESKESQKWKEEKERGINVKGVEWRKKQDDTVKWLERGRNWKIRREKAEVGKPKLWHRGSYQVKSK